MIQGIYRARAQPQQFNLVTTLKNALPWKCRELGHTVGMEIVGNSYPMTAQGSVQQCDVMIKQRVAKGCSTLASDRDVTTIELHNKACQ